MDIFNNISDIVDSLTNDTPNPYELVRNRLLETYTPTCWQLARQLISFPHLSGPTMNQLLSLLPPGDYPRSCSSSSSLTACRPTSVLSSWPTRSTTPGTWLPMRTRSGTVHHRLPSQWRPCRLNRALLHCPHWYPFSQSPPQSQLLASRPPPP